MLRDFHQLFGGKKIDANLGANPHVGAGVNSPSLSRYKYRLLYSKLLSNIELYSGNVVLLMFLNILYFY